MWDVNFPKTPKVVGWESLQAFNMRKTYRKMYRLTPLNIEIKRIEALIYKKGCSPTMKSYLDGLKTAHKLVRIINK